jgi:hypothetical protein
MNVLSKFHLVCDEVDGKMEERLGGRVHLDAPGQARGADKIRVSERQGLGFQRFLNSSSRLLFS